MKDIIKIVGGNKLKGSIEISGAKNSVLALMIASTMTSEVVTLEDIPQIQDVKLLNEILKYLGSNTITAKQGSKNILTIDNNSIEYKELLMDEVASFRASYYFLGALISRYKKCKIVFPGGCFLGPRPIDLHIKGLESLGCIITQYTDGDKLVLDVNAQHGLKGTKIFLDFPSVGATINILLASCMAEGETIIENAAKEPEIVDVATLLTSMGAKIKGAGTNEIRIIGVEKMNGCFHQVVPDRIEAGTYLMFGALLSDGGFRVKNVIPEHLEALTSKLTDLGIVLDISDEQITVVSKNDILAPVKIKTGVYPSFATDLQQVFVTLLTQVSGESTVIETIYPERYRNCSYLNEMGANIKVTSTEESGKAIIQGKTLLEGKNVMATDLRAGAALVFSGLIADGTTTVNNINHILRGYDGIVEKLKSVGANIELIKESSNE